MRRCLCTAKGKRMAVAYFKVTFQFSPQTTKEILMSGQPSSLEISASQIHFSLVITFILFSI
jgi:hypothetical protein